MTDRIREKIREVKIALEKVERGLPGSFSEFESLGLERDGIYKNVEAAIQSSYDICALIVKEEKLDIPGNEESLPDKLAEEGIITDEVSEKLKDMKGFRNALAHRYGKINDREAFENIKEGLEDFETFLKQIEDYLEDDS